MRVGRPLGGRFWRGGEARGLERERLLVHSTVAGGQPFYSRKYDFAKHPMIPLLADAEEGERVEEGN